MGRYLRRAEDLGFDCAVSIDHLLLTPPAYACTWLEPISLLSALAGVTRTMKLGTMKDALSGSLGDADLVFCYNANLGWDAATALFPLGDKAQTSDDLADLVRRIAAAARPGDHVLVMSNGGFGGIHQKLLDALQ